MNNPTRIGLVVLLAVLGGGAPAEEPEPAPVEESAYFTNVATEVGLASVTAKDVIFTDFDGDGLWDLVIDRQHFFASRAAKRFERVEKTGIEFPELEIIPLGPTGLPDREKALTSPYVPQYLYFADLDNDGDQDAVWGVHSNWEFSAGDGTPWRTVKECDPGVRTTVYLNDGHGRFSKAPPSELSAQENFGPAMALAIVDTDGDGVLDVYEGREYRQYGHLDNCGVDMLWKGDGKGGFRDVTKAAGLLTVPEPGLSNSSRPSYGVTHADVDGDGRQDLLQLAYGRQWNYLWRNRGDGTFEEAGLSSGFAGDAITHGKYPEWVSRPAEQPFRSNGNTFDCAAGDFDNDGDLDFYLGEIAHAWGGESSDPPSLLINESSAEKGIMFRRRPVTEFLPERPWREPEPRRRQFADLHTAWLDFDNDMRLDLLIGSGDYPDGQFLRLYRQTEDGEFADVTDPAGFDWEGCGDLSIGDFDRDGDVDIAAGRSFMRLSQEFRDQHMHGIKTNDVGLFRNELAGKNGNHWLNVRLVGAGAGGANASGIGARVLVTTGGVTQLRELRAGSGLANHQDPPEACFGLGKNEVVEKLQVRWNDAARSEQTYTNVPADQFVVIRQGQLTTQPR